MVYYIQRVLLLKQKYYRKLELNKGYPTTLPSPQMFRLRVTSVFSLPLNPLQAGPTQLNPGLIKNCVPVNLQL